MLVTLWVLSRRPTLKLAFSWNGTLIRSEIGGRIPRDESPTLIQLYGRKVPLFAVRPPIGNVRQTQSDWTQLSVQRLDEKVPARISAALGEVGMEE